MRLGASSWLLFHLVPHRPVTPLDHMGRHHGPKIDVPSMSLTFRKMIMITTILLQSLHLLYRSIKSRPLMGRYLLHTLEMSAVLLLPSPRRSTVSMSIQRLCNLARLCQQLSMITLRRRSLPLIPIRLVGAIILAPRSLGMMLSLMMKMKVL